MQSAVSERHGVWRRVPAFLKWRWTPVVALLGIALGVTLLPEDAADIVGPLGVLVGHSSVGWLIFSKAQRFTGRERVAWSLVGLGFLVAAGGVLVVAVIGAVNGSVPAFGPTDLIFVLNYLLILGGFASLPNVASTVSQRVRVWLDGFIGAVSLAVVLWATVLARLLRQLDEAPFWERLVASTYPVLDVVMLIVLLWVAIRRSTYRFDIRLLVFGIALAIQASADMTFFVTGIGKTFEEATPSYAAYTVAAAGFLTAGLLLHRSPAPREYADRRSPLWALVAPYTAAVVLFGMFAYAELFSVDSPTRDAVVVGAISIAVLVMVRQAVAIRENRSLVERQREALVSSISHELRTPLTSIVGFLEVMRDDEVAPEERRELTEIVHQQAVYMGRIVSDLVLLARGNPDQLGLELADVVMADVILESVRTVDQEGGAVVVDVDRSLGARVDPDRIEQVLVNLLTNAVRYGGSRRMIRAFASGGDLVIEVHDNGPGVRKKYELVIWERFERGPHRFDATVPGSGIGLAVVDAIVKSHGGESSYRRSERMGGACFSVVIRGCVLPDHPSSKRQPSEQPAPAIIEQDVV
jgi:signal transduction histidine kinase